MNRGVTVCVIQSCADSVRTALSVFVPLQVRCHGNVVYTTWDGQTFWAAKPSDNLTVVTHVVQESGLADLMTMLHGASLIRLVT
jgi:hypothetical protein